MLERMWSKRNTSPLLVGVQTGTATLEINMVVSQKIGNHSTSRPSYTTLGHIPKEYTIIPQGHMFNYVSSSIIHNSPEPGNNLDARQLKNALRKGGTYTMKYYAAEKKNDIMKYAGARGNTVLSDPGTPDQHQASQTHTPFPVGPQPLLTAQQLASAVAGVMPGGPPALNQPILIPFNMAGQLGGQQGLVLTLPTANLTNIQGLVAAAAAGGIMTLPLQNLQGPVMVTGNFSKEAKSFSTGKTTYLAEAERSWKIKTNKDEIQRTRKYG
ncbi:hypothetical protein STEG23_008664, partial [Scotinomys teguina]